MRDHEIADKALQVLNDLLDWEATTGGWEADVWKRARKLRDTLAREAKRRKPVDKA